MLLVLIIFCVFYPLYASIFFYISCIFLILFSAMRYYRFFEYLTFTFLLLTALV